MCDMFAPSRAEIIMPENKISSYCNKCNGGTNHDVLYSEETDHDILYNDRGILKETQSYVSFALPPRYKYEVIKCCGCGVISFRRLETMPDYIEEDQEIEIVTCYPPRVARRSPEWLINRLERQYVPPLVAEIMAEVYIALHNDSKRLATMGIRSALEEIAKDKGGGDQGSFTKNLDKLATAHYISLRNRGRLETIIEAGHAATHRGWHPTHDQIKIFLDITESLIETIYLHEPRAEHLEKAVPPRSKPKKS